MTIDLPGGRRLWIAGAGGGQAWLWSAVGLIALGLLAWLYREERRLIPRRQGLVLLALRTLAALLLLATLFEPIAARDESRTIRGRVLVGVDASASMDGVDRRDETELRKLRETLGLSPGAAADPLPRLDIARRLLEGPLARLDADHEVVASTFARDASPDAKLADVAASLKKTDGPRRDTTDWSPLLAKALQSGDAPVLGVVLLSDGRWNGPEDPAPIVDRLAARGIPVYPVLIGSTTPPPDVAVAALRAPDRVNAGDTPQVTVTVKADGVPAGTKLPVTLKVDRPGIEPLRQDVTIPADGSRPAVTFRVPLEEPGLVPMSASVDASAVPGFGDARPENDARTFSILVADDKARVLIVDAEARWEFRYLRNALARDRRVTVDAVVLRQPALTVARGTSYGQALPPVEGNGNDPLAKYDVFLIGDLAPGDLPAEGWARIEAQVAKRGATLVLAPGPKFPGTLASLATARSLSPLTDVRAITASDERDGMDPRRPPLLAGLPLTPRAALLDDAGTWPMLQLGEGPESSKRVWSELPRLPWLLVGQPKPGATVLAASGGPDGKGPAAFASQAFGLGQVLWVGTDSTWRWRFRVGDLYHHRFWGQVIRWAGSEKLAAGNKLVRHGPTGSRSPEGRPVTLQARLADDLPDLGTGLVVASKVFARGANGSIDADAKPLAIVPLHPVPGQPRLYQGVAPGLSRGAYRIRLDAPQLATLPGASDAGPIPDAPLEIQARETGELVELAADRPRLERLAAATGGTFTLDRDAGDLPSLLRARVKTETRSVETRLGEQPATLLLFFGILTVEWILRKRYGLP